MVPHAFFCIAALASSVLATPVDLAAKPYTIEKVNHADALEAHDVHRANHSASSLVWSDELAGYAQTLATSCHFGHNTAIGSHDYGQNIAAGYRIVSDAVHLGWYNNEMPKYAPYYGKPDPPESVFESVGHFTQVVWKGTKEVGCSRVTCKNDVGIYTVCNYRPAGNFAGQYGVNVGKPLGHMTVT